jgi:hypothetical protein
MRRSPMFRLALLFVTLWLSPLSAHGAHPADRSIPAPVVAPGAWLAPRVLRHAVARHVVNTPNVAKLIPRHPVLGGTWLVASENDVRYVAPGIVAIDYEDGHIAGRLVVRVVDATDPRTWAVLEDRER